MTKKISVINIIVSVFFLAVLALGVIKGIPLAAILNECITRFGRMAILVLAMLPTIRSGMGPNFGLPVGIVCGLLAEVIAIESNFFGLGFLLFSAALAILIAIPVGYVYGKLMSAVKGQEMVVGLFTGFSAVVLMNYIWQSSIFKSDKMAWSMGEGLRSAIQLDQVNANLILDKFLSFKIGMYMTIPTGLLLCVFLLCFLVYLFFRFKPSISVSTGSILSTVLGALGIIVYGQSIGYIQLYDAPMMMAFPAMAAIVIGGATTRRVRVIHVIMGAFIFNSLMATSMPVINRMMIVTDAPELIMDSIRQIIQNGIVLYAFIQFCKPELRGKSNG